MDRGIWITWYDLKDEGREAYLHWLHDSYLPRLLKRPGYLWAAHYASVEKTARRASSREGTVGRTDDPAVPTGSQYIQLVGAEHVHLFGDPSPSDLHAGLSDDGRKMLRLRIGERENIMAEAGRIDGPAAMLSRQAMAPAPCIQLGSFNCAPQDEEEVLAWYTKWRMPAMGKTPGCVRFRTLASVSGWAKHVVLYEFVSLEARDNHFVTHEDEYPDMKAWSDKMVRKLVHAPGSANVALRLWPPVGESPPLRTGERVG